MNKTPRTRTHRCWSRRVAAQAAAIAAFLVALLSAAPARAVSPPEGWGRWWLPQNHSEHGKQIDVLFTVIFIICVVVMVGVFAFMIKYCIKYRRRPGVTKAHFSHGNKRLELIWTVIPAVILLAVAVWTKGSWDDYRNSPTQNDPNRAQILVIAQQFAWNVVYPGPDGKLGRYQIYPKPTDMKWPALPADAATNYFEAKYAAVFGGEKLTAPGPAYLPTERAQKVLNDFVSELNPLGRDFADPNGKDDIVTLGTINIPKGRPVDINLTSKDVLHSFALPDYRVKLDAVPGMRGHIYFQADKSSAELEKASVRSYTIDELVAKLQNTRAYVMPTDPLGLAAVVPAGADPVTYKTVKTVKKKVAGKMKETTEEVDSPVADGDAVNRELVLALKNEGKVKEITCKTVYTWDLVCQELCGNGHGNMMGTLIVLEPADYAKQFEGKTNAAAPPPATAPAARFSAKPAAVAAR